MSETITQTLSSSQTLTVSLESNFGEIINAGLLLVLLAMVVLYFIVFRLARARR